ncbi:heavy-metal-associated domain-containing protein [Formosa maritima]|uniref:Heavy-metal-associated domain-containing protein n=1 Tax=Formosa maritima TaxID=2592046 RepID=A0A5D0G5R9_9FLAO|nr:heavy metal-associated domain-containing protein [Formosa maritima]TYA54336.1 heavy-metal-associated domain-containing protein [Formosa maritima]
MKTSIIVQNLKCSGCAKTIISKLSEIETISDIDVDVVESKISFKYINEDDAFLVKEMLSKIGYPSIEDENSMMLKTKSYISCATGKFK